MPSLMNSYARLPMQVARGDGVWLWDAHGKQYLDALGGIAVVALGHANPAVAEAISDQAGKLMHCSNLYAIPQQEALGEKLCQLAGMDKAFFCNSGAEANEAAIKIARLHGHVRGIATPTVIVTETAFHGRTLGTIAATGNRKIQHGFGPLMNGYEVVPYNDLAAIEALASSREDVVAVWLEPIQGEGGICVPDAGYLAAVRELCDRHDWLLLCDEIQCGMGRTGRWFGFQHSGIQPDVISLAKALGNGIPIGACLARGAAAELVQPGSHGTTFGGNPLACRVALTVIEEIERLDLVARAGALGQHIAEGLRQRLYSQPGLREIRGQGLMIGLELDRPCAELVGAALEAGLLINVTAGNVVRLLPPYVLSDGEADLLVDRLAVLISDFLSAGAGESVASAS